VADDAGEVAVFRELEVDVALFPLGARLPGVDRRVRGDVALVGGGGDAREVLSATCCAKQTHAPPALLPYRWNVTASEGKCSSATVSAVLLLHPTHRRLVSPRFRGTYDDDDDKDDDEEEVCHWCATDLVRATRTLGALWSVTEPQRTLWLITTSLWER